MASEHRFILGVDLDNVCANYTAGLRAVAAQELGVDPLTLADPQEWSYRAWGYEDPAFFELHRRAVLEHRLFRHAEVMPGAAAALHRLSEAGARIRIVTHRLYLPGMHAVAATDTVEWLDDNDIPYWDLCFVARKADVGCHVYVDDAPHNIAALREDGNEVIVYDWPYNRDLAGPRARDWDEVELLVRELMAESVALGDAESDEDEDEDEDE